MFSPIYPWFSWILPIPILEIQDTKIVDSSEDAVRLGLRCGWRLCGLQPPAETLLVELQQRQVPLTLLLMPEEEVIGGDSHVTTMFFRWHQWYFWIQDDSSSSPPEASLDLNKTSNCFPSSFLLSRELPFQPLLEPCWIRRVLRAQQHFGACQTGTLCSIKCQIECGNVF